MANVSRRAFLHGAGTAAAALVVPGCETRSGAGEDRRTYTFLNAEEASFIEAAVARLIPADENGPGALEADVPVFIDRQLASAWGAGAGLYQAGPWLSGSEQQGYQLPFTPAELFRKALAAIGDELRRSGSGGFAGLGPAEQDAYLKGLEEDDRDLGGMPAKIFFQYLLDTTVEGFFADPIHGGNRDMVGWKLVGFPGAYANYYEFVDRYGITFDRPPRSIADAHGASGEAVP